MTRLQLVRDLSEPRVRERLVLAHRASKNGLARSLTASFGKRMMVLKEPRDDEKGVLFVMFTPLFSQLAMQMDLVRLMKDYYLVLEPSWSGYCDPEILFFTQFTDPVFVLSPEVIDFQFLQRLRGNLVPIGLGSCDWVDPRLAEPFLGEAKQFDILMNSHWGSFKRHHVLFRHVANMSTRPSMALIGGPWASRTKDDVWQLARHFGVADQVEMFERIPYSHVMQITCQSRVSVLLSLKEGSNRSLTESMFCDVPVILLSENIGGARKNINSQTGRLTPEPGLATSLGAMLRDDKSFAPRAWACENISCVKSGEKLNAFLKNFLMSAGKPWTRDIRHHSNRPETEYYFDSDRETLSERNSGLLSYLFQR